MNALDELKTLEERATLDYFSAVRRGANDDELHRLLGVLDEIYCNRRRREGYAVDW